MRQNDGLERKKITPEWSEFVVSLVNVLEFHKTYCNGLFACDITSM